MFRSGGINMGSQKVEYFVATDSGVIAVDGF